MFSHYTRNYSSSQINLVEDRSSAHIRAHTCLRTREHTQEAHAAHPSTNVCTLANAYAPIRERALRKAANVIEAENHKTRKWKHKNDKTRVLKPWL